MQFPLLFTLPHTLAIVCIYRTTYSCNTGLEQEKRNTFCMLFAFQFNCAVCTYLQVAVYSAMRRLCIHKVTQHDQHYNELIIVQSNVYAASLMASSAHMQRPEYMVASTFENLMCSRAAHKHSSSWDVSYFPQLQEQQTGCNASVIPSPHPHTLSLSFSHEWRTHSVPLHRMFLCTNDVVWALNMRLKSPAVY